MITKALKIDRRSSLVQTAKKTCDNAKVVNPIRKIGLT